MIVTIYNIYFFNEIGYNQSNIEALEYSAVFYLFGIQRFVCYIRN
jgi:hypothetical protein